MTTVTTSMVREMRRMRRAGFKLKDIASAVGLHVNTVPIYLNDKVAQRSKAFQREYYATRIKTDPAKMEARRQRERDRHVTRKLSKMTSQQAGQ